jgi:hypothetical protein
MLDLRVFVQEQEFIIPGVGRRSTALQGGGKLMQLVVKCLLTTPGRDIFDPDWGVGIKNILPAVATKSTEKDNMPELSVAIAKANRDIIQSQVGTLLKPDELLDSLSIRDLRFNEIELRWELDLAIKAKSGTVNLTTVGT